MKIASRAMAAFSGAVLAVSLCAVPAAASDQGMMAAQQVDRDTYIDYLDTYLFTHVGDNRGPYGPDLIPCRDNIKMLMESYGLDVVLEPFNYSGGTYHNVVGTKVGTLYPDTHIIIGAHYDSVSNPGADDNASGVALVLEAARILSQYESDYTIKFIGFSMEEVGLYGSYAYANAHSNDDIMFMISADMVAYDTGTDTARVYSRGGTLMNTMGAAIVEYGDGLTWIDAGWISASDHAPFDSEGFEAALLIEGEVWNNPYYHQQSDNFENPNNLNFDYAIKMVRSMVGWLVDAAGVHVGNTILYSFPDGLPELVDPAGQSIVVQVEGQDLIPEPDSGRLYYRSTDGSYTMVDMVEQSPNVYIAQFPTFECGDLVEYYFVVESTDGQTFYSPYGAPDNVHDGPAYSGVEITYEANMDINPGWTTEGDWAYGQPIGGGGQYGNPDPTSGFTGPNVYGYNLAGDYPNNMPQRRLISTPIDCTGKTGVRLEFQRWLGVEQPAYDHAYIHVSSNGTSWTQIWENTSTITDGEWNEMIYDISAVADEQSTVYLRWTMGTSDGGWRYCGWNIDDVKLTSLYCDEPDCPEDLNGDGMIDLADLGILLAAYEVNDGGDIDGDGDTDLADLGALLARYDSPCSG